MSERKSTYHACPNPTEEVETFVPEFHDEETFRKMPFIRTLVPGRDHSVRYWSIISLGASAFGNVFEDVEVEECRNIVRRYLKAGVNVIDTAPWYGHGKSEEVLGEILPEFPRNSYYLHTKVGRYDPDPVKMFDFRASTVRDSVERSLERMKASYLDTVQVHDLEFSPSLEIILEETLPELEKLKNEGKIGAIGITGYPLDLLLEASRRSRVKLDTVLSYCRLSLYDKSLETSGAARELQKLGISVMSAAPLGMGLLTPQGPPDWHPAATELRERCKRAVALAKERGQNIARLALGMCLEAVQRTESSSIKSIMFSVTREKFAEQNLLLAISENPLTDFERDTCHSLMQDESYFGDDNLVRNWENVEVNSYWITVGQQLMLRDVYNRRA
eukprot:gb/GECG01016267.1/.p1 GENE.gb/GECG01016267.1/~~gb/GECG01016267.1/.p1  ORF type:complete len:389 (+),score=39.44 gb/GECG01016267.1/:1-1167(+)